MFSRERSQDRKQKACNALKFSVINKRGYFILNVNMSRVREKGLSSTNKRETVLYLVTPYSHYGKAIKY